VDHGVKVGIGIDEAGINDDRDMLQEMRLVLKLHRVPGMHEIEKVPTSPQVFQMATEHGAATTEFHQDIGTIEVGKSADLVLLDWNQISFPFLDQDVPIVDAVVHRCKTEGVDSVVVHGEVVYKDKKFTKVNKEEILEQLAESLKVPLTEEDQKKKELFGF
jgi:cytosine/adenosine deaminase-related metal-dependent hydrolase